MLLQLFLMFTKLGFLSVGGGYPMMALILQEGQAVGLTTTEFADMVALEMLASGPIAVNAATYIGFIKAGLAGSLAATAGICVAPLTLTSILYYFLQRFRENRVVQGFLEGIKIACGGVLITTAAVLAKEIFLTGPLLPISAASLAASVSWMGVLICLACAFFLVKFKANPIFVILASALAGGLLLR